MSRKAETKFYTSRVKPDLEKLPNTRITRVQQTSLCGDPDLMLCVNGTAVDIELKKDAKSKARRLQLHKLHATQRAWGFAFVASPENWAEIYYSLSQLAYGQCPHKIRKDLPCHLKLPTANSETTCSTGRLKNSSATANTTTTSSRTTSPK